MWIFQKRSLNIIFVHHFIFFKNRLVKERQVLKNVKLVTILPTIVIGSSPNCFSQWGCLRCFFSNERYMQFLTLKSFGICSYILQLTSIRNYFVLSLLISIVYFGNLLEIVSFELKITLKVVLHKCTSFLQVL